MPLENIGSCDTLSNILISTQKNWLKYCLLQILTENESWRKNAEVFEEEKTSLQSQLESMQTEMSQLRSEELEKSRSEEGT